MSNQESEPVIYLQDNEMLGRAGCGCKLFFEDERGNPAFTYCKAHEQALNPAAIEATTFAFDHAEAKGEIRVIREPYGLAIYVNGACLALIDLFNLATKGELQVNAAPNQGEDKCRATEYSKSPMNFRQIVIYNCNPNDEVIPAARIRWLDGRATIESDHHSSQSNTRLGHCDERQSLTAGNENAAQAENR